MVVIHDLGSKVLIWIDQDEAFYEVWEREEAEATGSRAASAFHTPRPDPTITFTHDHMNELVVSWLRGPQGEQGPSPMPEAAAVNGAA